MTPAVLLTAWLLVAPPEAPMDEAACVSEALSGSAQLAASRARVNELRARLAEVESVFYPKLQALAFIAPTFTVDGDAFSGVERRYGWADWGPYTHLEAMLVQPLYTFQRATAGERAASERVLVESARVAAAEGRVAVEVRRLYHLRLYALTLVPILERASTLIADARTRGQALYDRGTGEVSLPDLMKLELASLELTRGLRQANDGAALALAALAHTMGRPGDAPLSLADETLPPELAPTVPLATLLAEAAQKRPEWDQVRHGAAAAEALEQVELLANAPVLFLAGTIRYTWSPVRSDSDNPYHNDPYNDLSGGVAVGLRFDLDVAKSLARASGARALGERIAALQRFAETGIPLQVRKAAEALERSRAEVALSRSAVKASRRWMTSAGVAYGSGTGDARDLLEGVGAWVTASRGLADALRDHHIARAELDYAVGRQQ